MLELRDVSCGYRGRPVLSDVTFAVEPGETLCLLGPNGVGKTTLLRTVLGLLKPLTGEVRVAGRSLPGRSRREVARLLAYVPQAHTPPFPFSVFDVVLAGRTAHVGLFATPAHEDRLVAMEALDLLGVGPLARRPYTEISGGERQLVLIARAVAQEPRVLLLDEPSSNLDYGNQLRLLELVGRLAAERRLAVVMSTHFPDHALRCATTAALVKDGGVLAVGPADAVITGARLEEVYGVPVELVERGHNGSRVRVCVPRLATHNASPRPDTIEENASYVETR
jgi:iron complex transport system ATP-binding protein